MKRFYKHKNKTQNLMTVKHFKLCLKLKVKPELACIINAKTSGLSTHILLGQQHVRILYEAFVSQVSG